MPWMGEVQQPKLSKGALGKLIVILWVTKKPFHVHGSVVKVRDYLKNFPHPFWRKNYAIYSRVHKCWNEVFFKILKKPSTVQKKTIPHMKTLADFHWEAKKMKTTKNKYQKQKHCHFSTPTTVRLSDKRPFHC